MPFKTETNPHVKLTKEDVQAIKEQLRKGIRAVEIAKNYNVNPSTISRIKRNLTWR